MIPATGTGGASVAFNPSLHPRAPKGSAAGGQFTAGGSGSKTAPAKTPPKKAGRKPLKGAAAKAAQRKAQSVPFAELKRLTTMANQGKKLTPAQMAVVNAGRQAHADHVAHMAHVKAVAAKKPAAKAKTAAKPKAKPKK